jgi:hypothetical protein
MRNATKRPIKDHPHLSWEALPEGVACVEIAKQVQEEVDSEAFLASLPKRLREVLELRLAGYSWAEAAQRLGVKASTLRGYLPALRAKFVAFFGYDPSKRGFESLIYMEGKTAPRMRQEEMAMKTMGLKSEGFVTTQKVRGEGKSLSAWRVSKGQSAYPIPGYTHKMAELVIGGRQ